MPFYEADFAMENHWFQKDKDSDFCAVCGEPWDDGIHDIEGGDVTYDDFLPDNQLDLFPKGELPKNPNQRKIPRSRFREDFDPWEDEREYGVGSTYKKMTDAEWDEIIKKYRKEREYEVVDYTPNSDVLVIHPTDASTSFMDVVYNGKGYDVLNSFKGDMALILPLYSRVIMIGHGWVDGQFGVGQFRGEHLVINQRLAPYLKDKNNTYIWCKAADFVRKHGLKGYSTGMFISELREANVFKITATEEMVAASNKLFAEVMHGCIDGPPTLQRVLEGYIGDDPVTQYNRSQMEQF